MSAPSHHHIRCLLVAITLLACVRLHGAEPKWLQVSSDHFLVITDAGPKKGHEIAARFEQMRTVFSQLLMRRKVQLSEPIEILATDNAATYAQLVPSANAQTAGVFLRSEDRVFVVLNTGVPDSWRAIEHPFAHYLLDYNYPPTASWFDEGFAEYFSSLYFTPKKAEIGGDPELAWPGQPVYSEQGAGLKSLKEILDSPVWLSLTDLLEMKNRVVNGHEGTHNTLFYAQSWILVHYLLNQNKLAEAGSYFELVENQRVPVSQAVQQAFGMTPAQVDQQVKDYFHSLKALENSLQESKRLPAPLTPEPVVELPIPISLDEVADSREELSSPEANSLLAEIALRIPEHREDAFAKLEKLAADPKTETATAHRSLSWAYVQRGDTKKAFEELHSALEINASDPWSHFGIALAAYHSAQKGTYIQGLANTMESLHFVLDQYREFAEGYNILGWARLAGGGGNAAVDAMKIAVQLSPRDESYQMRLARAYLVAKKFDEATGTLDRLQHSRDPQIAKAAAKDLEELPFLKKYGVSPEEQEARKQQAGVLAKEVEESEPEDETPAQASAPKEPVIDKRPVKFVKGMLISVDCSQPPAAVLSVSEGRSTVRLRVKDFKSMTLIGAGEFSCKWRNLLVSANYREDSKVSGDLVSLEVQH